MTPHASSNFERPFLLFSYLHRAFLLGTLSSPCIALSLALYPCDPLFFPSILMAQALFVKSAIMIIDNQTKRKNMAEKRLAKEWTVNAFDREKGEFVEALNKSYEYEDDREPFSPAVAARITPSRKKSIERDYKSIFVFGDSQIDYRRLDDGELMAIHDERAMKLARYICRDLQPDNIVNLGDTVDLAALSRFKPDSDHFHRTIGPSLQRTHDFYAELRSDNPNAKITEVDSNHNVRLKNFVLKNMPQMYGVRRAGDDSKYPVMTYPHLANLEHVGVDWVGGYGAAQFEYADDLAFMHGTMASAAGSTAQKLSKENPDRNVVQGHAHRAESFHRTDRHGRTLGAYVVGALCRTTGEVPSYHSGVDDMNMPVRYQENWQQGAMHIKDYGDGNYQFDHILFRNGKAFYDGKEYNGE